MALLISAAALLLAAPPVAAHPFGDPQTVEISADAAVVRVHWQVGGPDDLTQLAAALGLLPRHRVMLDGAVFPEPDDATLLAASEELETYLLDRIEVDGCRGEVESTDDLAAQGVLLAFTCPEPVTTAVVTVRTLTDLHPAYRTMASSPDGQRAVYDADHETQEWDLAGRPAPAPDLGRSAAVQMGATVAVLAGAAAAAGWALRQRRRHA